MKKVISIALVLLMVLTVMLAITGCGDKEESSSSIPVSDVGSDTQDQTAVEESQSNSTSEEKTNTGANESMGVPNGTYVPGPVILPDGTKTDFNDYLKEGLAAQGIEEGSQEYEMAITMAEVSYTFREDGTMTAMILGVELGGTYTMEGTTVNITLEDVSTNIYPLEYDAQNNTLTATEENTGITTVMVAK